MKIARMKVYYKRIAGVTVYRDQNFDGYPACWDQISPVGVIYPTEFGVREDTDADGTYQTWLVKMMDSDYDISMFDPRFSAISRGDAQDIAEDLDPDIGEEELVTNEATVARLTIKAMRGQAFTKEDDDALEPTAQAPGIGKKKSFINKHDITW